MNPRTRNATLAISTVAFLLWFWPNFIHEPLHLLALYVQGVPGTISFDLLAWPATPVTHALAARAGIIGGLFYVLLPSVFSITVIISLYLTRQTAGLLSHVALPIYLFFDLLVNIMGHPHPTNDFHFLTTLPWLSEIMIISIAAMAAIYFITVLRSIHTSLLGTEATN